MKINSNFRGGGGAELTQQDEISWDLLPAKTVFLELTVKNHLSILTRDERSNVKAPAFIRSGLTNSKHFLSFA